MLKLVFSGKKDLIPLSQIKPINVPRYDELSVTALIKDVMAQPDLARFFPDQKTTADLPDRDYFFGVVNTKESEYLSNLIIHAQA